MTEYPKQECMTEYPKQDLKVYDRIIEKRVFPLGHLSF